MCAHDLLRRCSQGKSVRKWKKQVMEWGEAVKECDLIPKSTQERLQDSTILVYKLPSELSYGTVELGSLNSHMCQLLWLTTSVGEETSLSLPKTKRVLSREVVVQGSGRNCTSKQAPASHTAQCFRLRGISHRNSLLTPVLLSFTYKYYQSQKLIHYFKGNK